MVISINLLMKEILLNLVMPYLVLQKTTLDWKMKININFHILTDLI